MIKLVVDEIRKLSQDYGLTDVEIAELLGVSRVTVCRVRRENGIPRANRQNRMDKQYTCMRCHKVVTIPRKERKQRYCPECKAAVELEKRQKRREYSRKKAQESAGE